MQSINKQNKKVLGLLGRSLAHSFSRTYFLEKFANLGLSWDYQNFELQNISELPLMLATPNLLGFNVTIPYKQEIIPYLHVLSDDAEKVGAVNVVKLTADGLMGYNTDIYGFSALIKPFLTSEHHRVLVLGKGGAARAVHYVFAQMGIDVFYATRNPQMQVDISYEDLQKVEVMAHFKCVVNTTPLGMYPEVDTFPLIAYQAFDSSCLAVDLVYNPLQTEFLKRTAFYGATVLSGKTMLLEQAEKAWEIWNL